MSKKNIIACRKMTGRVARDGADTVKPSSWLKYCTAIGKIQATNSSAARELQEEMVKVFQVQGHVR